MKLDKKNLLLVFLLFIILLGLNSLIFNEQLNYGFRDVDWMSLYYYKLFGNLSFNHLLETFKVNGTYTHQVYYVGFLEQIFGLNFRLLHLASQMFKIFAALSIYFLILKLFKNKLLAFLTSVLYTISYTNAGPLFQLSTGSYFPGVILMNIFFIVYWKIITEVKGFKWLILADIFLMLAFFITTERMYPLFFLIIIIELITIIISEYKRAASILSFKRLLFIFLPLIILFFIYNIWFKNSVATGFAPNQFFVGAGLMLGSILKGNWQLLLYPLASFGSIFLYGDLWKYLGQVDISSFTSYFLSLIFGPLLRMALISIFLLYFISKNFLKLTAVILSSVFGFALLFFFINSHWNSLDTQIRIHFDPNLVLMPAIFGFFITTFCIVIFFQWIKTKNNYLLPLIIGPAFSLLLIFLTWIASDLQLVFMGPQRYLSIPSIGTSLLIAGMILIIFNKLRKFKVTSKIAWGVFLILIPLILINYNVASKFFSDELNFAGLRGDDQTRMKNTFRILIPNINKQEKSLFYFDETADHDNGYFDESTILAGFEYWTRINGDGTLNYFPDPGMMRTNVQCSGHTHASCIEMLKMGLTSVNGEPGILYKDIIRGQTEPSFYKLNNFYALRFINKQLVDIRKEVLGEIQ